MWNNNSLYDLIKKHFESKFQFKCQICIILNEFVAIRNNLSQKCLTFAKQDLCKFVEIPRIFDLDLKMDFIEVAISIGCRLPDQLLENLVLCGHTKKYIVLAFLNISSKSHYILGSRMVFKKRKLIQFLKIRK